MNKPRTKIEVKQDPEAPIAAEVIAKAIIDIDASAKAILTAGLKYETIVTLIHDHSGLSKRDIRLVLNNLTAMRQTWCSK
jgi:hypothetical protein